MSRTIRARQRRWRSKRKGGERWWRVDSRPKGNLYKDTKQEAPSWWVNLFDTRPQRRRHTAACHAMLNGADPDAMPLGVIERRPHVYYW